MDPAEIIQDIEAYIARIGGRESSWYIGIASKVGQTLFIQHKVDRVEGAWIHREVGEGKSLKSVIKSLRAAGCDAAPDVNEQPGNVVYVFLKTADTTPPADQRIEKMKPI